MGILGQHSRRAKDGHARPDLRQRLKRINELGHDTKNPPRILFDESDLRMVIHWVRILMFHRKFQAILDWLSEERGESCAERNQKPEDRRPTRPPWQS